MKRDKHVCSTDNKRQKAAGIDPTMRASVEGRSINEKYFVAQSEQQQK
jgi:hypothetical protein